MPLYALPLTPAADAVKSRLGYVAQEALQTGEEGVTSLLEKVEYLALTRADVLVVEAPDIGSAVKNPQAFTLVSAARTVTAPSTI